MVLEALISDQLNKFLGAFVEGIDSKQLGASIMSGSLKLQNMKLKQDLFDDSPLPFELEYGQVGKIYIKIPIWDMFASPLIINIENIFGLVKLKNCADWDQEIQKEAFRSATQAALEQFELKVKQMEIFKQTQKQSQGNSFVNGIIASIIDNIQIKVKNVYFRFEDDLQGQKKPFAIGLKLQEFSIGTMQNEVMKDREEDGAETTVKKTRARGNQSKFLTYKKVTIKGFSVFCDYEDIHLRENGGVDLKLLNEQRNVSKSAHSYFKEILEAEFGSDDPKKKPVVVPAKHKYLMENFHVTLKVQLNKDIKNPTMPGTLSFPQVEALIVVGEQRDPSQRQVASDGQGHGDEDALTFFLYQPQIINVLRTLETIGFFNEFKEGTLLDYYQRQLTNEENLSYQKTYLNWRLLQDSKAQTDIAQAEVMRAEMKTLEDQCSAETIIQARQDTIDKIDEMMQEQENNKPVDQDLEKQIKQQVKKKTGWFTSSQRKKQIAENVRKNAEVQDSIKTLMDQFNDLDKDSEPRERSDTTVEEKLAEEKSASKPKKSANELPKDYIQYDIELIICALNFSMVNEFGQKIIEMRMVDFLVSHQQSQNITRSIVQLEDFEIRDMWSGSDKYEYLIEARELPGEELADFIKFEYPTQMISNNRKYSCLSSNDYRVPQAMVILAESGSPELEKFKTQPNDLVIRVQKPLYIVAMMPLVNELARTVQQAFHRQALDFKYFEKIQSQSLKKLREDAAIYADLIKKGEYKHQSIQIDLAIHAPVILVPSNIFKQSNYIEVNTGFIQVKSFLQPFDEDRNYIECENENELYDRYDIGLTQMGVSLKNDQLKTKIPIIKEINYHIAIDNCLAPLHPKFPSLRLQVDLDQDIDIEIDVETLYMLLELNDQILIQLEQKEINSVRNYFKRNQKNQMITSIAEIFQKSISDDPEAQTLAVVDKETIESIRKQAADKIAQHQLKQVVYESVRSTYEEHAEEIEQNKLNLDVPVAEEVENLSVQPLRKEPELTNRQKFDQEQEEQKQKSLTNLELIIYMKKISLNLRGVKTVIDRKQLKKEEKVKKYLGLDYETTNTEFQSIQFVMENLSTRVFQEASQQHVNLRIQTLQIIEGTDNVESLLRMSMKQLFDDKTEGIDVFEKFDIIKKNDQKVQIFKRIMSSPYDDAIYMGQGSPKDEALRRRATLKRKTILMQEHQEQQMDVQIITKYTDSFDEEFDSKVSESDMDIYCIMNKQRIIINFDTMAKFIGINTQLMQLQVSQQEDFDLRELTNIKEALKTIKLYQEKEEIPEDNEINPQMRNLLIKNLENLASKSKFTFGEYLEQTIECLENTLDQEISVLKVKYQHNEKALERIEEIVGKKEMDQDDDEEESEEEEVALFNLEQQEAERLDSEIRFDSVKTEQPEESKLKRDRTFTLINKSKGKVSRMKEKIESAMKKEKLEGQIKVVESNFVKSRMNIKLRLKNIELWVSDYTQENQNKKAQILQLKFLSDLSMHQDSYYMNLTCIQPKTFKVEHDPNADADQHEDINSKLKQVVTLNNSMEIQMNVDELSIEQLLVERWIDVQSVALHLCDRKRAPVRNQSSYKNSFIIDKEYSASNINQNSYGETNSQVQMHEDNENYSVNTSQDEFVDQEPFSVRFFQCKILNPTCIQISQQSRQEYKKIRFYETEMDINQFFLTIDFKDIDFFMYLSKRFQLIVQPEINNLMAVMYTNAAQPADNTKNKEEETTEKKDFDISGQYISQSTSGSTSLLSEADTFSESKYEFEGDDSTISRSQSQIQIDLQDEFDSFLEELLPPKINDYIDINPDNSFKTDINNLVARVDSVILCISDGEIVNYLSEYNMKPSPLIEVVLDNIVFYQNMCKVKQPEINPFMAVPTERYFYYDKFQPPYSEFGVQLRTYATYHNILSQAYEPFIEPWEIDFASSQKNKDSIIKNKLVSNTMLEINCTTGMAQSVNSLQTRLNQSFAKIEHLDKIDEVEIQENKRLKSRMVSILNTKDQQEDSDSHDEHNHDHEHEKTPCASETPNQCKEENSIRSHSCMQKEIENQDEELKFKNENGYRFSNYSGTDMKIYASNHQLYDRNSNKNPASNQQMIKLEGFRPNEQVTSQFVPHEFFDRKVLRHRRKKGHSHNHSVENYQQTYVRDYIEELPNNIDIEIGHQLIKLQRCQIDNIGVYSFKCKVQSKSQTQRSIDEPANSHCCLCPTPSEDLRRQKDINVIVNISSEGMLKHISFESQLLIANNLLKPITLVFHIKKLNNKARVPLLRNQTKNVQSIRQGTDLEQGQKNKTILFQYGDAKPRVFSEQEQEQLRLPSVEQTNKLSAINASYADDEIVEELFKEETGVPDPLAQNNNQDIITYVKIERQDVFRVPLMWMMPDSKVDVYILEEKDEENQSEDPNLEEKIPLLSNIGEKFSKTANDEYKDNFESNIQSKFLELNDDFYVAMDVQAYCCLPKMSQEKNPLQYVLSFNSPILMTNYFMNPLQVFEIDDAQNYESEDFQPTEKVISSIAPSMSDYVIELDMTKDNKSQIKFQINDTEKDMKLSSLIEDNDLDQFLVHNPDKNTFLKQQLVDISDFSLMKENQLFLGDMGAKSCIYQYVRDKNRALKKNDAVLKTIMFKRHQQDIHFNDDQDETGNSLDVCQVEMETVKKLYQDMKSYNQNFASRQMLIDISIACKIMVYPKYMMINKSIHDIIYHGDQVVKSKTNDFIIGGLDQSRMKIRVKRFSESQEIDLRNIGVAQGIVMNHQHPQNMEQLQFGVSISPAPWPYNKTTLITIVPQYLLINNLKHPIKIRQLLSKSKDNKKQDNSKLARRQSSASKSDKSFNGYGRSIGNEFTLDNKKDNNQRELHLHRVATSKKCFSNDEQNANMIQFKSFFKAQDYEIEKQQDTQSLMVNYPMQQEYPEKQGLIPQAHKFVNVEDRQDIDWGMKFAVNEAIDFQTDQKIKTKIQNRVLSIYKDAKQWYEPNEENNYMLTTRVIVQPNSSDAGATQLIMFNDPSCPDYKIVNKTAVAIECQRYNSEKKQEFGSIMKIYTKDEKPFVWDSECPQKKIKIVIKGQEKLFSFDAGDKTEYIQIDQEIFSLNIQYNEEGTKMLLVKKEPGMRTYLKNMKKKSMKLKRKNTLQKEMKKQKDVPINDLMASKDSKYPLTGQDFDIWLKGVGIQIIDNEPKPLMYIRVDGIRTLLLSTQQEKDDTSVMSETKMFLQIWNFQIDNMGSNELPVLMGPSEFYSKNLINQDKASELVDERDFFMEVEASQLNKSMEKSKKMYDIPFILVKLEMSDKKFPGSRGSIKRFEHIKFGMQEFQLSLEDQIINSSLKYFNEISQIFKVVNYDDDLLNWQIDVTEVDRFKKRSEICPMVDASKGVEILAQQTQVDKVSFGTIWITAIKVSLTCQIKFPSLNFDLSDPSTALFSIFNILKPFINQLASITDSIIRLNELMITEGCLSQEKLIAMITQHVTYSVISQVYKLLGSSDLIGNPVRLIDKVGTGFYQLARDPIHGLSEGSPQEFIKGIGSGVQAVVRGAVGGLFLSTAQLSNSMYEILKETTGQTPASTLRINSLPEGVYFSFKGTFKEVFAGITGILVRPYMGLKSKNTFRGFVKGLGQGFFGFLICPLTAFTRSLSLVSLGLSVQAIAFSNWGKSDLETANAKLLKSRPSLRVDVRGQIKNYSQDIAFINELLEIVRTKITFVQNQQMRFFSVLPRLDAYGREDPHKKCVLLITTDYILLLKVPNFFRMQKDRKIIFKECLVFCDKLSNIVSYKCLKYNPTSPKPSQPHTLYFLSMVFQKEWMMSRSSKRALMPVIPEEGSKDDSLDMEKPLLGEQALQYVPGDKSIYKYVFYSPSYEILNRVHQILLSVPEIQKKTTNSV